jgi:hypothetical protein
MSATIVSYCSRSRACFSARSPNRLFAISLAPQPTQRASAFCSSAVAWRFSVSSVLTMRTASTFQAARFAHEPGGLMSSSPKR